MGWSWRCNSWRQLVDLDREEEGEPVGSSFEVEIKVHLQALQALDERIAMHEEQSGGPSQVAAVFKVRLGRRGCPSGHLCPGGSECLRRDVRAGEPYDVVAAGDQLWDERRADPTRRAGDKNTHENLQVVDRPCSCVRGRCQLLSSPYHLCQ